MCGIVGVIGPQFASRDVYQALLMLQHRGQDSAGILSVDATRGQFHLHKALGQVANVFTADRIATLPGDCAIGHTRYSTIGAVREGDLQPMAISHPTGVAMVHNGNLSNQDELRSAPKAKGRMYLSGNDLEDILHSFADSYDPQASTFEGLVRSVKTVFDLAQGGYAVVGALGNEGLFGFRDPHGIRPLLLATRKEADGTRSVALGSETGALKFLGFEIERDIKAGEVIFIPRKGEWKSAVLTERKSLPCQFEWVYFSSADSSLEGKNVYEARLRLGALLAGKILKESDPNRFDVVVSVPDTSRPAAIGLAERLHIPLREALIKNRYVQRSFILSGSASRSLAVKNKFSVVDELVAGKRVLLVDDSIVRGTTSLKIIELLKQHGAKEVSLASTCPPILHPCFYGIAFPTHEELIASGRTLPEIAKEIRADGVFYTDLQDLQDALGRSDFCDACLTGKYPYPVHGHAPGENS